MEKEPLTGLATSKPNSAAWSTSLGTKVIQNQSTNPQGDPTARVRNKFELELGPKLKDSFLCPPLRANALMAVVRDVTRCSSLTYRCASLIATLEGQRYQRSYDH